MVARPVAIALLTCGTLCCSFDFGSWGSGYESPPTEGCTTQSAGCPSLGPIPAHAYAAEAGSGGFFDQSCPSNYTCVGGWASCGDDCDTSVVGDPNNCGACGNTCASGTCTEGSCLAVDVLAGGFGSPSGVALDADSVYFGGVTATASGILTVPKAGGAIANDAIHTAPPTSIAVDGTGTYFAIPTDEDLVDSPILVTRQAGDPIVRLGGYAGVGSTVMLGGGSVFWSGEIRAANGGSVVGIFSVPEVGGAPTLVTPIEFDYFAMPTPMLVKGAAMQGGDLFYVDGRNVMVLRAGAATPTLLYTDPSSLVIDITTDEASVYWYGFFAPSICAPCSGDAGATASEVRRMPLGGGAVDMLFAPDDGTEIFAAAGDVFTIVGDTLSRFDTATSSSTTLTRGSGAVSGFASDATFIYWTVAGDGTADPTTGGKLLRLAL